MYIRHAFHTNVKNMHNPHCQPTHGLINAIAIAQERQDMIKSEETQSTGQGPLGHSKSLQRTWHFA